MVVIKSDVGTTAGVSNTALGVSVNIGARSASGTTISGVVITPETVGSALKGGDVGVGIDVAFGDSFRKSVTLRNGEVVSTNARAAVFLVGNGSSGNVMVVTSQNSGIRGAGDVYVAGAIDPNGKGNLLVQVTVNGQLRDVLVVSNNGSVGVGKDTGMPATRLGINGIESGVGLIEISNETGPVVRLDDSGALGVNGGVTGSSKLAVNGTMSASTVNVSGVLAPSTLSVSSEVGGIVVKESGNVGIGTTSPVGQFELNRT
ncbi:MAG: hypothetical protein EBT03_12130, partial [Betaproteobacteria bacterium]|nr:hypothetical protein [Betaproteobacteria bacterium]